MQTDCNATGTLRRLTPSVDRSSTTAETGPSKHQVKGDLAKYWKVRGQLSVCDNLLLYGMRIVVPKSKQAETLQKSTKVTREFRSAGNESLLQSGGRVSRRTSRSL